MILPVSLHFLCNAGKTIRYFIEGEMVFFLKVVVSAELVKYPAKDKADGIINAWPLELIRQQFFCVLLKIFFACKDIGIFIVSHYAISFFEVFRIIFISRRYGFMYIKYYGKNQGIREILLSY